VVCCCPQANAEIAVVAIAIIANAIIAKSKIGIWVTLRLRLRRFITAPDWSESLGGTGKSI
jgi:hypothetical protein